MSGSDRYAGFSLRDRDLVCRIVLELPQDKRNERALFTLLLPLTITQFLFYPVLLLGRGDGAFAAAEVLLVLKDHLLAFWKHLPKRQRGARWPADSVFRKEFGEPQCEIVLAVWPAMRFIEAFDKLQRDGVGIGKPPWTRLHQRLHQILLRTVPLTDNYPDFRKEVSKKVNATIRGSTAHRTEVTDAVMLWILENSLRNIINYDPLKPTPVSSYWSSVIRNAAIDASERLSREAGTPAGSTRRKYRRNGSVLDPQTRFEQADARECHYDPTGDTKTASELARGLKRHRRVIEAAVRKVEKAAGKSAPRQGRFMRLDEWWQAQVAQIVRATPKRRS